MTGITSSDEELVAQTLGGNPRAFEELIRRYQKLVFNIAYHHLGRSAELEDIAQDVFLKSFRALESYQPGRSFKAWIARITVNCCLDELRRRRVRKLSLFSDMGQEEKDDLESFFDQHSAGQTLTDEQADKMLNLVSQILSDLPESERSAFVLRELEGLEYPEIAETLGTTELAIRIRVSRARKKIIDFLESRDVI